MPVIPEVDSYHASDAGDNDDVGLHDGLESSLHFSHVSQQQNPYALSALQPDMGYTFSLPDGTSVHTAYPLPDPNLLSQTRRTERRRPPGKKNSDQPHIPRPRNAFILFRSAFIEQKNGKEIASKQQNLSRIAAMVWKSMSAADQDPWYKLAAEEKQAHYAANPGYTFQPTGRGEIKRKTRKPTTEPHVEETSCKRIADLIISGVQGDDLITAAKTEGVAPFQRSTGRRRQPMVSPNPPGMGVPGAPPMTVSPMMVGHTGAHGESSDDDHVHYPAASPGGYYERAPSPKF